MKRSLGLIRTSQPLNTHFWPQLQESRPILHVLSIKAKKNPIHFSGRSLITITHRGRLWITDSMAVGRLQPFSDKTYTGKIQRGFSFTHAQRSGRFSAQTHVTTATNPPYYLGERWSGPVQQTEAGSDILTLLRRSGDHVYSTMTPS